MTTSYLISDFVQALQDLQKTAVGEKARADSAALENKKLNDRMLQMEQYQSTATNAQFYKGRAEELAAEVARFKGEAAKLKDEATKLKETCCKKSDEKLSLEDSIEALQMAVAKRDEEISALKKSGNRSVLRKKLTEALARAEKAEKSLSQQYLSQYYPYYSWFAAF